MNMISENIRAMLEELGFKAVEDYTQADLIMLNTCSIRENAHNKAFWYAWKMQKS